MLSIQNAQKNRRSSERNFKNRPEKPPEKPSKLLQKYRNGLKLDKIFLSHYQGVEVLEQKKDFKIFGQNRKRQYFCNPKRRGKQGERMRGSRREGIRSLKVNEPR